MTHTLTALQRRMYLLQVLFAGLAIVLLLQIGTRFDRTWGAVPRTPTYGPLQLHSGAPLPKIIRSTRAQLAAERRAQRAAARRARARTR